MLHISPSVLSANFATLGADAEKVRRAGASMLHLDVMDGVFVPNMSFGMPVIASLRKKSRLFFDVHLMITDPGRYIDQFAKAGADIISFHYESCDNHAEVIKKIKNNEVRAAMAISPATPYEVVLPFIKDLSMVLVMTVVPGFGGQKLIPETLEKVRALRKYANENGLELDIEVDGGITLENMGETTAAGANVIVSGSTIFNATKPKQVIAKMHEIARKNPFVE